MPRADAGTSDASLDHEERSRITREHVLKAAVEILVSDGYSGASTLRIQERAGVSRGRLLHQFPQRDLLLVAAAQHLAETRVHVAGRDRVWPEEAGARREAAVGAMWDTYHDLQGYFWASTELWLAARHNASLAAALIPGERTLGRQVRDATDLFFGQELASLPHYPETRELLNTSMRGVALTYAFEPRDHTQDAHLVSWRKLASERLG